jgi:hypothetical protein
LILKYFLSSWRRIQVLLTQVSFFLHLLGRASELFECMPTKYKKRVLNSMGLIDEIARDRPDEHARLMEARSYELWENEQWRLYSARQILEGKFTAHVGHRSKLAAVDPKQQLSRRRGQDSPWMRLSTPQDEEKIALARWCLTHWSFQGTSILVAKTQFNERYIPNLQYHMWLLIANRLFRQVSKIEKGQVVIIDHRCAKEVVEMVGDFLKARPAQCRVDIAIEDESAFD